MSGTTANLAWQNGRLGARASELCRAARGTPGLRGVPRHPHGQGARSHPLPTPALPPGPASTALRSWLTCRSR
eukprot:5254306-Pyramimonas_sp.AAC.1